MVSMCIAPSHTDFWFFGLVLCSFIVDGSRLEWEPGPDICGSFKRKGEEMLYIIMKQVELEAEEHEVKHHRDPVIRNGRRKLSSVNICYISVVRPRALNQQSSDII